jgi:molecular chaperone DnaJ
MTRMGMFTQMSTQPCNECQGRGKRGVAGKTGCGECQGKGSVIKEHRVELKAPRGVQTGHTILVPRLGEQSPDSDDLSGDLLVEVMVQSHSVFRRIGNDLHIQLPILFAETVTGKHYTIDHFDTPLDIASATFGIVEPGRDYRMVGKGMPGGDLVIQFKVTYPSLGLTDTQRNQVKAVFESVGLV